jgi:hypothetical protein
MALPGGLLALPRPGAPPARPPRVARCPRRSWTYLSDLPDLEGDKSKIGERGGARPLCRTALCPRGAAPRAPLRRPRRVRAPRRCVRARRRRTAHAVSARGAASAITVPRTAAPRTPLRPDAAAPARRCARTPLRSHGAARLCVRARRRRAAHAVSARRRERDHRAPAPLRPARHCARTPLRPARRCAAPRAPCPRRTAHAVSVTAVGAR